jgi:filamentous hemagglutinin family protein
MAVGESATKVVTAVVDDADLREKLIAAPESDRRQILADAGLLDGLSDEDYAHLRKLSSDPVALNEHLLERVTGGDTATSVGGALQDSGTTPTANSGGATIAGDAVVAVSGAVVSTGMGAAAIGVVVGGAAFGF